MIVSFPLPKEFSIIRRMLVIYIYAETSCLPVTLRAKHSSNEDLLVRHGYTQDMSFSNSGLLFFAKHMYIYICATHPSLVHLATQLFPSTIFGACQPFFHVILAGVHSDRWCGVDPNGIGNMIRC